MTPSWFSVAEPGVADARLVWIAIAG